ncbi:NACHT, LRR and PYD domains-containing protein 3-like [Hemitrygon akajei]|uniref:NACHT, LRR and PYD domains-containing protein 3-like n=1 Tax=Hemitrygon akajei TaxID=2704970 RepID=UPI003BF99244
MASRYRNFGHHGGTVYRLSVYEEHHQPEELSCTGTTVEKEDDNQQSSVTVRMATEHHQPEELSCTGTTVEKEDDNQQSSVTVRMATEHHQPEELSCTGTTVEKEDDNQQSSVTVRMATEHHQPEELSCTGTTVEKEDDNQQSSVTVRMATEHHQPEELSCTGTTVEKEDDNQQSSVTVRMATEHHQPEELSCTGTTVEKEDDNQQSSVTVRMATEQNLITSDRAGRGGAPVTSTSGKVTGLSSVITELLANWDDFQLLQLMDFYRDRLEQAMEGGVHGVSLALTAENQFSGEEHRKISDLADKGERADSSKLLLSLVMEKGSRARRVMWETFVKMRIGVPNLDKIVKEIQIYGCDPSHQPIPAQLLLKLLSELKDVQQKHKDTLRAQTETLRVNTILMREKVKVFQLVDRYAELTVISTVRDLRLVEHELLARGRDHEEWREKHLRRELEKISTRHLFQRHYSHRQGQKIPGCKATVAGVPGIGKTTMVQKIVYDWATGKIYQQFQFVFSFKFRDLNSINHRINLKELILDQYPYFENILREVWKNPEGLLFIFDGLDEFKHRIDFADSLRDTEPKHQCPDPEWRCEVSDIVYSLIQGKLLPGCSVLVTTHPTALHLLEKADISVWAEILGFVGEEREEYFNRHFEDQTVAAAVFKHMKENEILYTMSYNPSYCWILALALGPFFTQRVRDPQRVPKTITQLYSYYIYNILKNHSREIEKPRDVLLRVGQMAFKGVSDKKFVFTDGDLINYNLQPSQFLSGFLMELLEREDSAQSVVYTFPHLTIQEFVAAVAQFLNPHPGDILKFLTGAHKTTDGRFEVFLRFVAGLSSPMTARGLEDFLGPFPHQTTCRVIDWVKEEVKHQIGNTESEAGKRSLLNTLHYLFESQNRGLAQAALGSVETLSFSEMTLTPIDCAVLSHVIGLCDTIKQLDLAACHIQCEGIQRLGPGLHKCQELRLGKNDLGDSGVKLVSAALRNLECKLQKLGFPDPGEKSVHIPLSVPPRGFHTSRFVSGITVILLVNCLVSLVMSVLTAIANCRDLECCAAQPPVKMVVIHANQPAPPDLASIFSGKPAPTPALDGPCDDTSPYSTGQPERFGPSDLRLSPKEKSKQDFRD